MTSERFGDRLGRDWISQRGCHLQGAQGAPGVTVRAPGVTVRQPREQVHGFGLDAHARQTAFVGQGTFQQPSDVLLRQRFQNQRAGP
ncbi:hypothetical protein GCM10008955_20610 [Deinococcus malanensis]|uniref:Uncharacterized protein n=1 Tax=Deinococcus malanensis TaxID=1706855 RepID=A0ABQ2EYC4_9DEIO|nr:hypothetical protein GCM10008955_20610 [Deinococcus malanensis]